MKRRLLSLMVVLAIALSIMTAFSATSGAATKVTSAKDSITVIYAAEPETIDPALNSTTDGSTLILHAFEGLTRIDAKGNTVPGVAEKWTVSKDGKVYTFKLRKNAKWSDGVPVTAKDFDYAWKRAIDPKLASPYSFLMYYIKNAEDYFNGKTTVDKVGIKVVDDYTLEVTLKTPTSFFLDLVNQSTYMPVRKDIIEANAEKWTQDPATYIGNGAYKLTSWTHSESIKMTKSETYWDSANVGFIKNITWKLTDDQNTAYNAYLSKQVDALLNNNIPAAQIKTLMQKKELKIYPNLATYYFEFSVNKKPFDNKKVRQAMSLAINREYLVENITGAGQKPAVGFVPYGIKGAVNGTDFRSEKAAKKYISTKPQISQAKKLLAEAGYPNGKGLPTIEVVYNTSSNHQKISQYLQQQWEKNLGIKVKLTNMEFKVLIPKRQAHDFQIARAGWSADFNDPITFLDLFTQANGNNDPDFNNKEYEKQIKIAQTSADNKVRMAAMHKAEAILMEEMPVIPLYYYVTYQLEDPKLAGMVVTPQSFVYLQYAYFKK